MILISPQAVRASDGLRGQDTRRRGPCLEPTSLLHSPAAGRFFVFLPSGPAWRGRGEQDHSAAGHVQRAPGVPLWAVHISDGQLEPVWLLGGFVLAGLLALVAGLRLREEDLPRVALLGAAFFVASQIHVRLGPTSAHLLLNGLAGVLLGWQATLAIAAGLFLQKAFFDHGGYLTLGVNVCVMALPALAAGLLFRLLYRPGRRRPRLSGVLVGVSALAWTLSLVFSVALLATNRPGSRHDLDPAPALRLAFHPLMLAAALVVALLAARAERRLAAAPEFALGLLLGELAVLLTLALNAL